MTPIGGEARNANPEEAAVTGGVPAPAEAPPITRGRLSSFAGFAWLCVAVGLLLVIVAFVADQDSDASLGTAIAGVALLLVGVLSMVGLLGPATAGVVAFAGGLLLTAVAFTADGFGVTQAVLLLAGALCFIGSFASLASSRQLASGRGDEEPQAGVENI